MTGLTLLTAALSMHIGGYFTYVSTPRADLDQCERQLSAEFDACKQTRTSAECMRSVTTASCVNISWKESYAAFLDRRIEEMAAEHEDIAKFISLTRLKQ